MKSTRARLAATAAVALAASLTAACATDEESNGDAIDLGLLVPLSGALEVEGADAKDAFELYLEIQDGQLGGRDVEVSIADEGDSTETSLPSAEKLIKQDQVDLIAGTVNSANYIGVAPEASAQEIPLFGFGGQPDVEALDIDLEWLWQTSYTNSDPGEALAPYMEENIDGPVYAIGPDYEGGYAFVNSFTEPFLEAGGELANDGDEAEWTAWPDTSDFIPYFNEIANSDAEAIFSFYAGAPAIDFVQDYADSDASDIPLYGPFLTEGAVLDAQGEAAEGVHTVMNYSPDIDNDANRTFVSEWSEAHPERQPNLFSMAGWDAALVIDQAIASIDDGEEVTSEAINEAMGNLGTIDSPRGSWQLSEDTHAPIQQWYLRTVESEGDAFANKVTEDLETVGG